MNLSSKLLVLHSETLSLKEAEAADSGAWFNVYTCSLSTFDAEVKLMNSRPAPKMEYNIRWLRLGT